MPTNFALAANGGIASATSWIDSSSTPGTANNGNRGYDGLHADRNFWHSGNPYSDSLTVLFNAPITLDSIRVYTVGEANENGEPNSSTTFSRWGATAYTVQYLNSNTNQWTTVHVVAGNDKRLREFAGINANNVGGVRLTNINSFDGYARIAELEAWGDDGSAPQITTTNLPDALVGAAYDVLIQTSGGGAPVTVAQTGGALPAGLSLKNNRIAGTPVSAALGSYYPELRATGVNGAFSNKTPLIVLRWQTVSVADKTYNVFPFGGTRGREIASSRQIAVYSPPGGGQRITRVKSAIKKRGISIRGEVRRASEVDAARQFFAEHQPDKDFVWRDDGFAPARDTICWIPPDSVFRETARGNGLYDYEFEAREV